MDSPTVILPPPASWLTNDNKKTETETGSKTETETETDSKSNADGSSNANGNANGNAGGSDCRHSSCSSSEKKLPSNCQTGPCVASPFSRGDGSRNRDQNGSSNKAASSLSSSLPPSPPPSPPSPSVTKKPHNTQPPASVYATLRKQQYYPPTSPPLPLQTLLPLAARELIATAARNACYHARRSYVASPLFGKRTLRHSEVGSMGGGYQRERLLNDGIRDVITGEALLNYSSDHQAKQEPTDPSYQKPHATSDRHAKGWEDQWDRVRASLPPFSSLRWVDRQLVKEWRTVDYGSPSSPISHPKNPKNPKNPKTADPPNIATDWDNDAAASTDEDVSYSRARSLYPRPLPRPPRENASSCYACLQTFSSHRLRHHCRLCGRSYCHDHSRHLHRLPHLGYDDDVPERVCAMCKETLDTQARHERIAWRVARCRDCLAEGATPTTSDQTSNIDRFLPYFSADLDTVEDAAARVARAAIRTAKTLPMGAQATVAVETLDILRKHGWKGFYGLVLRKEFMAAADLLCRVTGINRRAWPLSVHELSVAVFYALAQQRARRGDDPEREHRMHGLIQVKGEEARNKLNGNDDDDDDGGGDGDGSGKVDAEVGKKKILATTDVVGKEPLWGGAGCLTSSLDDEAGDEVLWRNDDPTPVTRNMAIDETDRFDPMAESVVNLLAMDGNATGNNNGRDGINPSSNNLNDSDRGASNESKDDNAHRNISSNPLPSSLRTAISKDTKTTLQSTKASSLPFTPVCTPLPDSTLSSLIFYAPIALNFVYAESEVDMQLLAAQQGWRLVYAHLHQNDEASLDRAGDTPASALFVHLERKIACFAIRGTATINDVVTDIRQMPVKFPDDEGGDEEKATAKTKSMCDGEEKDMGGSGEDEGWTPVYSGKGLALCGMAGAAYNLFRENIDTLLLFARRGYRIRLTGHSMGGSVASLMGSLVQRHFDAKIREGDELGKVVQRSSSLETETDDIFVHRRGLLRVYAYGSAACADAKLSDYVKPYVITCVLHDDVVPRLTPTSIRGLMKHLLYIRETWVKAHLAKDLTAVKERAKTAWAPKVRNGFSLLSAKTSSLNKKLKQKRKALERRTKLKKTTAAKEYCDQDISRGDRSDVRNDTRESDTVKNDLSHNAFGQEDDGGGGDDASDEGLYYEGDCFYEAEDSLLEETDEEETDEDMERYSDPVKGNNKDKVEKEEWDSFEDECSEKKSPEAASTESSSPVLLDEMPLPRMFIPGKIVHIYSHRGGYKTTFVPRAFRELRRISLSSNMINDHTSKWYYEALLECRSIRNADRELPEWTGFREETTCSCCASLFTWASTLDSKAQEARDKHNCRSCGSLVCDPCSRNRVPIPSIGITVPSRVCDRCYNDGLTDISEGEACLTSSFLERDDNDNDDNDDCNDNERDDDKDGGIFNLAANDKCSLETNSGKDRRRVFSECSTSNKIKSHRSIQKRNVVVDELAARVNSSGFRL